jgi:thiol-disulfide isomerase/thioredoxin
LGGLALLATLASSAAEGSHSIRVEPLPPPAVGDGLTPFLAGSASGLHLIWLEKTAEGHALRYARWDGTRFTPPSTVHASGKFFANWADFSSVLPFGEGRLAAHWLEKAAAGTYEYDVFISISDDGGKTWSPGMKPHRDGTLNEHGFVSLSPEGKGFRAVWLDGRNFKKDASDNEMALLSTSFDGAAFGGEEVLDSRVCECCQTAMAPVDGGFFVAYRDRSPQEIRDVGTVRYDKGAWSEPRLLNDDGWHLTGCPVNGPQAASDGNRLALAWFTASKDDPRVQVVFSEDGGKTFGAPIRVDSGRALGRVDIELLGDSAVVTWLGKAARGGEVLARRVSSSGDASEIVTVARTGSDRASGFPRIASFQRSIYAAWTEAESRQGPSRIQLARLVLEEPSARAQSEGALTDVASPGARAAGVGPRDTDSMKALLFLLLAIQPSDLPRAKDFEAKDLAGTVVRLSALKGKVVLLNFWGVWCKSCRQEIPHLSALDREWRDKGLVVLGADYGDAPEDIAPFAKELEMSYPILVDDGLAEEYEVLVYPTSVVVDRKGFIRMRVEGYDKDRLEEMKALVEDLLREGIES